MRGGERQPAVKGRSANSQHRTGWGGAGPSWERAGTLLPERLRQGLALQNSQGLPTRALESTLRAQRGLGNWPRWIHLWGKGSNSQSLLHLLNLPARLGIGQREVNITHLYYPYKWYL